jgi:hypothetical protein
MSFWSGLKVFGKDIVKVFAWAGSPRGQQVIGTGEGVIEAILPISIPIVSLFNSWFQKAYTVEALAVAAGQASGTGVDKAALAIQTITPQILQYAQQEGLKDRTAAQIQAANDAVVAFIKAMTQDPPTA